MKIKTSALTSKTLDWAVAKASGDLHPYGNVRTLDGRVFTIEAGNHETADLWRKYSPSTDWAQGGPILDQECLIVGPTTEDAAKWESCNRNADFLSYGPTALIAIMRCYVTSNLGEEIDIPDELA